LFRERIRMSALGSVAAFCNRASRALRITGGIFVGLLALLAIFEALGWPFLERPLERMLSEKLHRSVSFEPVFDGDDSSTPPAGKFSIRFLGGLRISAPQVTVAAPEWSKAPHLLFSRDTSLELRYSDLWRAYRGKPIRIDRLKASELDGNFERLADGRASWQFRAVESPPASDARVPSFGKLEVAQGLIRYVDAPFKIDIEAQLSLANGGSSTKVIANAAPARENVFQIKANGRYRDLPMKLLLISTDVLPWAAAEEAPVAVPITLNVTVGRASLDFKGSAMDAAHFGGFKGRFNLKGPSLAAVGDALGVTLPTTAAFRTDGAIVRRGDTWNVLIEDATVGSSRLNGAFVYETARAVPLLSGTLGGARLLLADLGPSIGLGPAGDSTTQKPEKKKAGAVLPNRPYELTALRRMDANVLIDMTELDLGSKLLEPLRPLHTHLQLKGGVLTLTEIDARTGQGRLNGSLALDGRQATALWSTNLAWNGVQLERFIRQERANQAPPFVSGKLSGNTVLRGEGKSTAEILGSLNGKFHTELSEGTVSRLGIEFAGLDVAESLGLLFSGDKTLPVECAVADLTAEKGTFKPRVMVIDTSDTAIWVEGSLSLASEELALRAVVMPKDFSPLTLRSPLRVTGTFADPSVSIDKAPLGKKLGTAFLLALANPLAALIPLIDGGDTKAAQRGAAGCKSVLQRASSKVPIAPRARQ
jgi:AsmA family protein